MHATVHKFMSAVCYLEGEGGGALWHEGRLQTPSSSAAVKQIVEKVGTVWGSVSEKTFWGTAILSCCQETCLFSVIRRQTDHLQRKPTQPPKFTLANISALDIWESFNYLHQGGCFFFGTGDLFFLTTWLLQNTMGGQWMWKINRRTPKMWVWICLKGLWRVFFRFYDETALEWKDSTGWIW